VLLAGAGGAGVALLAACSSGGGTSSPTHTTQDGSGGSPLATLSDINVGRCVPVTLPDGSPGIVARPSADKAVCFSAVCTHMGCTVAPAGAQLNCPCHGSQFNALTGQVLRGPAASPLPEIPVKVTDGQVMPA
jgi:Rieske Fe-S protein